MESERVCICCGLGGELVRGKWVSADSGGWVHAKSCIPIMKSRISSLEAALSLDDEKIEKIASEMYGVPIDRAPSAIAKMYRSHAITAIKELRKFAGLEGTDGE